MAVILIADDQVDACRPLALLLKHLGHRGVCVDSGEAALAYLRTRRPDLLILDVMMPGMDGIEVLRHVRGDAAFAELPIVMFSAISDPTFQHHAKSKGATDFWVKASLDFATLGPRIERLLSRGQSAATADGKEV